MRGNSPPPSGGLICQDDRCVRRKNRERVLVMLAVAPTATVHDPQIMQIMHGNMLALSSAEPHALAAVNDRNIHWRAQPTEAA